VRGLTWAFRVAIYDLKQGHSAQERSAGYVFLMKKRTNLS